MGEWLDNRKGIGHIAVGMARQDYDLRLTRYATAAGGRTYTFSGFEHFGDQRQQLGWEPTPFSTPRICPSAIDDILGFHDHRRVNSTGPCGPQRNVDCPSPINLSAPAPRRRTWT